MTFPWELRDDTAHLLASPANAEADDGIPAFLRRDASNRAPFMGSAEPQACTGPPSMPWSADFNKPTE